MKNAAPAMMSIAPRETPTAIPTTTPVLECEPPPTGDVFEVVAVSAGPDDVVLAVPIVLPVADAVAE